LREANREDFATPLDASKEDRALSRLMAMVGWYQLAAMNLWEQGASEDGSDSGRARKATRMRTVSRILLATYSAHLREDDETLTKLDNVAHQHIREHELEAVQLPDKKEGATGLRRMMQTCIGARATPQRPGLLDRGAVPFPAVVQEPLEKLLRGEPLDLADGLAGLFFVLVQGPVAGELRAGLPGMLGAASHERLKKAFRRKLHAWDPALPQAAFARELVRAGLRAMGMSHKAAKYVFLHEEQFELRFDRDFDDVHRSAGSLGFLAQQFAQLGQEPSPASEASGPVPRRARKGSVKKAGSGSPRDPPAAPPKTRKPR
jgi:hypothetical protein